MVCVFEIRPRCAYNSSLEMRCRMFLKARYLPCGALALLVGAPMLLSQEQAKGPSLAEKEDYLLHAKVIRTKPIGTGITHSSRVTLSDGQMEHDAHVQTIDVQTNTFSSNRGTELNFKDSYKFNIAGYRLNRILVSTWFRFRWNEK